MTAHTTLTPPLTAPPAARAARPRGSSPRRTRQALRIVHLVLGAALGAYVYLPTYLPGHAAFQWTLMLVVVPVVTITGLWMWKQAAVRRLLARGR